MGKKYKILIIMLSLTNLINKMLFNTLERALAKMARYQIMEFKLSSLL